MMKRMGAKKVAAVGYGLSPSSSASAQATETYGAKAQGLESTYLNTSVDFGSTDVGSIVLGIKNSGADGLYLPLDAKTNFAIVQGLQQTGVPMKANVLASGYSQDLLDQPAAKTITPNDVMFTAYRPVELGGKAVKAFQSNMKKYGGLTGVPNSGEYSGYIACDLAIYGLKHAGKNLTRQGFVDAVRNTNRGLYDSAGLTCTPTNLSYQDFGKVSPTSCVWFVGVEHGKFKVLNGGKPVTGKLVGDPKLIEQYQSRASTRVSATTAAPSS
jgi:branched-chain amino acid transport system substrate-binding protein